MEIQEIADKLGVHRGTLFHWMSGNRSPSKQSMLKIEEELGWPASKQMKAFNTPVDGTNSRGKPLTDYGAQLRAFLEKKFNIPPAMPGRVGPRT